VLSRLKLTISTASLTACYKNERAIDQFQSFSRTQKISCFFVFVLALGTALPFMTAVEIVERETALVPLTYSCYLSSLLDRDDPSEWQVSKAKWSRKQSEAERHRGKNAALIIDVDLRDDWLAFAEAINTGWYWRHFTKYHYFLRWKYFARRFQEFAPVVAHFTHMGGMPDANPRLWRRIKGKTRRVADLWGGTLVWTVAHDGVRWWCTGCWRKKNRLVGCDRCGPLLNSAAGPYN
jgi:hypothetical protein